MTNDSNEAKAQIIIHHLSDIHYGLDPHVGGKAALNAYLQPLLNGSVPLPDMLVITGDLTIGGSLKELSEVAQALDPLARAMAPLGKRVFVVPGPHDLFWVDANFWTRRKDRRDPVKYGEALGKAFGAFYDIFTGPNFAAPARAYEYPGKLSHVSLLDTCYRPIPNPPEKIEKDGTEAEKAFNDYLEYHEKWGQNSEKLLTQMVAANPRDRGQCDAGAARSIEQGVVGAEVSDQHLRILVTHHPLFASSVGQQSFGAPEGADAALRAARARDVQLLLHGHTHQPSVIATSYGAIGGNPSATVVQVGGGTLAQVDTTAPSYNIITAQRDALKQEGDPPEMRYWSVRVETVSFTNGVAPRSSPPFLLGRATEQLLKRTHDAGESDGELAKRRTIAHKTDGILRVLAKLMQQRAKQGGASFDEHQLRQLSDDMTSTVALTMRSVREMVEDTIFAGTSVSLGLLVKPRQPLFVEAPIIPDEVSLIVDDQPGIKIEADGSSTGSFAMSAIMAPFAPPPPPPENILAYKYLLPRSDAGAEWQSTMPYISTMAGWSLILGETLIHTITHEAPDGGTGDPRTVDHVQGISRSTIDMTWLSGERRTTVVTKLHEYIRELTERGAAVAGHPEKGELDRVTLLVEAIERGDPNIALDLLFLPQTTGRNGEYNPFVSVPVPHRLNGFESDLSELGVLQIDTKTVPDVNLTATQGMLLSDVAHVVWMILATANAIDDYQNALSGRVRHLQNFEVFKRRADNRAMVLWQKLKDERERNERFK